MHTQMFFFIYAVWIPVRKGLSESELSIIFISFKYIYAVWIPVRKGLSESEHISKSKDV